MNKMPKRITSKALILLLAGALSVGGAVGSTVAWLADSASFDSVTFTDSTLTVAVSDSTVTDDSDTVKKMIPGHTIDKAPVVTVNAGSEDCYLFIKVDREIGDVKVEKPNGETFNPEFEDYISYNIIMAENNDSPIGWHQLIDADGYLVDGVHYRVVSASENYDQAFYIFDQGSYEFDGEKYTWTTDQILVNPDVTNEMMAALDDDNCPKLSISAYAIQYYKSNDTPFEAHEAWANISY